MRLINTTTFQLEEFFDSKIPKYAILSHTWEKEEVLFSDMAGITRVQSKIGFQKFQGACALAVSKGFKHIWIDTCCIDKSSSAELSEAINSMYMWYTRSDVCFAYLCDVAQPSDLGSSRWFTRGWTLQELIAPRRVEFYSGTWEYLGEKQDSDLISLVSLSSLVDECVLAGVIKPQDVSVAKRMYWASKRTTTRKEDEAYCLMGLFNVNMPLLYGEGGKSFLRLQQEITKITNDQSILAWYPDLGTYLDFESPSHCLAPSPQCFNRSGDISLLAQTTSIRTLPNINIIGTSAEFSVVLRTAIPGWLLNDWFCGCRNESGDVTITGNDPLHAASDGPSLAAPLVLAVLYCQAGPIPGTFPAMLLTHDPAFPGSYARLHMNYEGEYKRFIYFMHGAESQHVPIPQGEEVHGKVTSLGLNFSSPTKGLKDSGDDQVELPERIQKEFSLSLQRIMLSRGVRYDTDINHRVRGLPYSLLRRTGQERRIFWIVILDPWNPAGGDISISEVYPIGQWDRSSLQCFIELDDLKRRSSLAYFDAPALAVAGIATITLPPYLSTSSGEKFGSEASDEVVALAFGLISDADRDPLARNPKPWCKFLRVAIRNEDTPYCNLKRELAQLSQSDVASMEFQPQSSCSLGSKKALKASVTPTLINGRRDYLIKLWEKYSAEASPSDSVQPWTLGGSESLSVQVRKRVGRLGARESGPG